jgi:hypothetical protein
VSVEYLDLADSALHALATGFNHDDFPDLVGNAAVLVRPRRPPRQPFAALLPGPSELRRTARASTRLTALASAL